MIIFFPVGCLLVCFPCRMVFSESSPLLYFDSWRQKPSLVKTYATGFYFFSSFHFIWCFCLKSYVLSIKDATILERWEFNCSHQTCCLINCLLWQRKLEVILIWAKVFLIWQILYDIDVYNEISLYHMPSVTEYWHDGCSWCYYVHKYNDKWITFCMRVLFSKFSLKEKI